MMRDEHLADEMITFWSEGPGALSEESRKRCREVQRIFARALSGSDLVSLQEEPQENRQRIEDLVAVYLVMGGQSASPDRAGASPASPERGGSRPPSPPREERETAPLGESAAPSFRSAAPVLPASPSAAPADESSGARIRQSNQGGVNVGTLGSLEGGLHVGASLAPSSPTPSTSPASKESERTRILFLGASPSDQAPLRLDEEVRAIDRALASATLGNRCELVQKWAVRVGELQEHMLRAKPQIVHFSGHGDPDRTLRFQDDNGISRPVEAERLARLLGRFSPRLQCVVLNACYTEAHGAAIVGQVDCVVGMATAVSDRAALRFSAAFYRALASGCSVGDAFEQAKVDIELGEMGEDETPILLHRRDPAQLFLVREAG